MPTTSTAATTAMAIHKASMAWAAYPGRLTARHRKPNGAGVPTSADQSAASSLARPARLTFWLTTLDEPPGVIVTP